MSLFGDIGNFVSGAVNTVESAASGVVNLAEGAVGGAVNIVEGAAGGAINLAEGAVSGAVGIAGQVLNTALSPVEGLLGCVLGPIFGGKQSAHSPFSSSVLNPAQLATSLSSASDKLGGVDLSGINSLEDAANTAQAASAADPNNTQKQLEAQQALIKLQTAVNAASTEMNILGDMAKKATDNSRLQ